METIEPKLNDYLKPDLWPIGSNLLEGDNWTDESWPGCQYRIESGHGFTLAINIKLTGKPRWDRYAGLKGGMWKTRCKIEFVHDGEPNEYTGGFLYHKSVY